MKIKQKSLSDTILLVLEKAVDGYARFEDFAYNPGRYAYGDPTYVKKRSLAAALQRLREKGFIEKIVDEQEILYKLTQLGRDVLEDYSDNKSDWDGKWRIVIFDIPEQRRAVRDMFRRRLKGWKFKIWQQSVWVTDRNITGRLRTLIAELKIQDWVVVIESDDPIIGNILFNGR